MITGIEDPKKVVEEKWQIWAPKIFYKAKLEAQANKKTYKELIPVMSELGSKSTADLCNGEVMCIVTTTFSICFFFTDPNASIILLLLRRLVNSKMSKQSEEILVVLEVCKLLMSV